MGETSTVRWRVLGDVGVEVDGARVGVGGARNRAVLASLVIAAPSACSVGQLIAELWGDRPPKTARNSLQRFVADLRRSLGAHGSAIVTVDNGYRLIPGSAVVDLAVARAHLVDAGAARDAGDIDLAARHYALAVDQWDGTSLGGVGDAEFVDVHRERLEELRRSAIEGYVASELDRGRHDSIASLIEEHAAAHPARDRAWELLVVARYRSGRQADALAAARQHRHHLVDVLGLDPSPVVAALEHRVLEHDLPAARVGSRPPLRPSQGSTDRRATEARRRPIPMPVHLADLVGGPFVGRERELTLIDQLTSGASVRAASMFVAGMPGGGKSRFAAEAAARVRRAGGDVVFGRCSEDVTADYQPWRTVFAQVVEGVSEVDVARHRSAYGSGVLELADATAAGAAADRPDGRNADDPALTARATVGLLEMLAADRPVLVVLDDLQWVDAASLRLVRAVTEQAVGPVVVLGLYRSDEVDEVHLVTRHLATVPADAAPVMVGLDGLDVGDVRSLISAITEDVGGFDVTEMAASRLTAATNGNPFFLIETLKSLADAGRLDTLTEPGQDFDVPASVRLVVSERVDRLGDSAASTLRFASVFGREFDLDVLAVANDRDELAVLAEVELALAAGLIVDAPEGRDRFAFAHDLLHQTLSAELSRSRRALVHVAIAGSLERLRANELDAHAAAIATHLFAAGRRDVADRTLVACRRAGRAAMRMFAPDEAVVWFERVAELVRRDHPDDDALLAESLVELGRAQRQAVSPGVRDTLVEAARVARRAGHTAALVEAVTHNSRAINGIGWETDLERIEVGRMALEAVGPDDSTERAGVLAALLPHMWTEEFADEVAPLYEESVAIAERLGDPVTSMQAIGAGLSARNYRFGPRDLARHAATLTALSREVPLGPEEFVNVMNSVVTAHVQLADRSGVDEALRRIHEAHERFGVPSTTNATNWANVLKAGLRGDVSTYRSLVLSTYEHAARLDRADIALVVLRGQMFFAQWMEGREGELVEVTATVHDGVIERPYHRAIRTLVRVGAGLREEAEALLERELRSGFAPNNSIWSMYTSVVWAECAAELGHVEAAAALRSLLSPTARYMAGQFMIPLEPAATTLARLCTLLGDVDEAEAHLDTAERIGRDFEGRWMRARVQLARAETLRRRGRGGDGRRVDEYVQEGLADARDAGYAGVERQLMRLV